LKLVSNGAIAGIIGIVLAHIIADFIAALLDPNLKSAAFGIVLAITSQAAMNLGVVTRLLPTKGIALPFISAGGTHLFLTAAAVGILVSIAKRADEG